MVQIRLSQPSDGARLIEIWRSAVDATHDFLSPEDRASLEAEVKAALPALSLWIAVDEAGEAVGFMGLTGSHMDSLFIASGQRGKGIGRLLVEYAAGLHAMLTTDVNAQNAQAVGFYEKLGFMPVGRSDLDDQDRPYPLIHMKLSATP